MTVAEVIATLEWPRWIADYTGSLREHTRAIFYRGEIDTHAPMNDDFVGQLRVVATFYDLVGVQAVIRMERVLGGAVVNA